MRLVTNSFAPLARIFRKSEYFLYRLSLSRQLSATLSATACKYLAAVGRGHTLTEAVLLGALTLLGLIGTNHACTPPVQSWRQSRPSTTAKIAAVFIKLRRFTA